MRILSVLLIILVGLLLWTIPGRAQDCFPIMKSIEELDTYTKANDVQAAAWIVTSDKHPSIQLVVVWFAGNDDSVYVSGFRDGCLVLMPDGTPGRMAPITPQVHEAIGRGTLTFTNLRGPSPFETY